MTELLFHLILSMLQLWVLVHTAFSLLKIIHRWQNWFIQFWEYNYLLFQNRMSDMWLMQFKYISWDHITHCMLMLFSFSLVKEWRLQSVWLAVWIQISVSFLSVSGHPDTLTEHAETANDEIMQLTASYKMIIRMIKSRKTIIMNCLSHHQFLLSLLRVWLLRV